LPEIVLTHEDEKKNVLRNIFDRWLYRDIFGSVKDDLSFVSFIKYL